MELWGCKQKLCVCLCSSVKPVAAAGVVSAQEAVKAWDFCRTRGERLGIYIESEKWRRRSRREEGRGKEAAARRSSRRKGSGGVEKDHSLRGGVEMMQCRAFMRGGALVFRSISPVWFRISPNLWFLLTKQLCCLKPRELQLLQKWTWKIKKEFTVNLLLHQKLFLIIKRNPELQTGTPVFSLFLYPIWATPTPTPKISDLHLARCSVFFIIWSLLVAGLVLGR